MHQDATWYGGSPQHRGGLCVRWGPHPLLKKGAEPPIFGPCLLRLNGCMDQDATWYRGRPRPRRHCVRWGPSPFSPKRGQSPLPQFLADVYCGQTARGTKMALGMEVGLGPGRIVLDGYPAPLPKKGAEPPIFRPFLANVTFCSRSLYSIARPSVCLSSVVCNAHAPYSGG